MAWSPFRGIGLKLAALGLGLVLWMTVSGQQVERSVLVQLQFRNVPSSLEITGNPPRTVDVRLRGTSGLISRLETIDVVATIDVTDVRPGVRVFPLTVDQISAPLGVQVMSVDPSTVSLTLEESATADVPVKATIDGEPAAGFDIEEVVCEPKTVTIRGPASRVKAGLAALTERISVEGVAATMTETVSMAVSDSTARLRDTQNVRVTIKIVPAPIVEMGASRVGFRHLGPGHQASADPATAAVSVRAGRAALAALRDQAPPEPYVDVAGLGPGRYNLPVKVDSAGAYVAAGIDPATVAVRIR